MSDQGEISTYASGCQVVHGALVADDGTGSGGASGGMSRGSAVSAGGVWMGVSELPPGHSSSPHHHEGQTTIVSVVRGSMSVIVEARTDADAGALDREQFDVGPGEMAVIPGGLVHREVNDGDEACLCVVVRNAPSPVVVNLE